VFTNRHDSVRHVSLTFGFRLVSFRLNALSAQEDVKKRAAQTFRRQTSQHGQILRRDAFQKSWIEIIHGKENDTHNLAP
jgi:hypothetical protein